MGDASTTTKTALELLEAGASASAVRECLALAASQVKQAQQVHDAVNAVSGRVDDPPALMVTEPTASVRGRGEQQLIAFQFKHCAQLREPCDSTFIPKSIRQFLC